MEESDVFPAQAAGVSAALEEMRKSKETRSTTPPSGPGGDSSQISDIIVEDLEEDAVPNNCAVSDQQEIEESAQMLEDFVSEIVHAAQEEACRRELAFLSVKDDGESFESEDDLESETSASTSLDSSAEDEGAVAFPRKRIQTFKSEAEFWHWEQVVVRAIEEEFRAERGVDVATKPLTLEEDREIRRRIIEELYGEDFPVDQEVLVEFIYTILPAMFRKAAWFDARYAQIEINDPQVDVDVSLFLVPNGHFRDKSSLPKPFTDIHTVEQQRKKREELLDLACYYRRELEKHFFPVADAYALPRFWKKPLANFDRLIFVLQRKVEDAKALPEDILTKPAVQQDLHEVATEVENILVEAVDTDLKCLLCHEVLNKAMGLVGCGHVFCSSCLDQWLTSTAKTTKFCPTCKEVVNVETDLQPVLRFTWLWLDEKSRSSEGLLVCDECKMYLCHACEQKNANMEAFLRWLEINNMDLDTAAQICAEVENMRLARRCRRVSI
ncbi:uncharacterized protein LOC118412345 [Branchiostoma floridae]|uniref:Uncharacterized protein LOC118412345 n=1 Tax=Branchiostoma floridae TaxID=7739 RepID=C3Z5T9_BRAFL|nr:uncharacterized protein LOC118412345 [Branchiostoma floridae]|eukprot:XP_002596190.1 hypothetical protein BRAFLDRAFT_66078 [Branchiostoma floridae]